jgi:hypothetical protein
MFYAYEKSEDVDELDLLRRLSEHPGVHSYPFIEIPLNTHLFHVDVAPIDDESRWQRFIFDRVENIFAFAADEEIEEFRVHLQSRRNNDGDYELKRVVEIAIGTARSGEVAHVFLCADGSMEIGSLNELSRTDIFQTNTLWIEPGIRA